MWSQIIFIQFIEFDSCNYALKLVLYKKLKFFFDSYFSHDFLDPSISIQSILSYKCIQCAIDIDLEVNFSGWTDLDFFR